MGEFVSTLFVVVVGNRRGEEEKYHVGQAS